MLLKKEISKVLFLVVILIIFFTSFCKKDKPIDNQIEQKEYFKAYFDNDSFNYTKKDTACFIEEDKDLGALFYKDSTVCYNSINLFAGKIDLDNLIYPYSFEKEVPNSPKPFASMVYRKKYLDTLVIDYILKSGYNGSIITLQNYTKNGYLIGNFSGKFYGYSCFIHPICIHEYIPCDDIFPFDSIEIKKGSFCFKVTRK